MESNQRGFLRLRKAPTHEASQKTVQILLKQRTYLIMSRSVPLWKASAILLLASNPLIAANVTKPPSPQCPIYSVCSGDFAEVKVVISNRLTRTYTSLIDATDVTSQSEVSGDLITSKSGTSFLKTFSTTDNGDEFTQTVVVRDNTLVSNLSKCFIRLKVVQSSN